MYFINFPKTSKILQKLEEKGVAKGNIKYSALQIKLGGKLQGDVQTLDKPKIKAVPNPSDSASEKKS